MHLKIEKRRCPREEGHHLMKTEEKALPPFCQFSKQFGKHIQTCLKRTILPGTTI